MDALKRLAQRIGTGAEVALGLGMAMVIAFNALVTSRADAGWPFGLAAGLAICSAALLRRRGHALAAGAGLALFAVTGVAVGLGLIPSPGPLFGGGLAGLLVLGAAAARTLPPRLAAVIGVAGTAVIAAAEATGPGGPFSHPVWVLAGTTLWSAALAAGLYLRYLDFLHRQMLETVRRQERLGLARELHDIVTHHVTGIVVQAQAARFAGRDDTGALLSTLGAIESAGLDTLSATRALVGLLRDPADGETVVPGPEPISQLVRRFAEHGPAVDLRLPAGLPACGWPPEVASTVYRVVQEALTNISRHAPAARSVVVAVGHDGAQVTVEVSDDAPALVPAARHPRGAGYGLVGMAERVEALGGRLHAGPLPGSGWAVRASLPVAARAGS